MRTEDDLRAAFSSLERREHATGEVLAGIRAGVARRRRMRMGGGLGAAAAAAAAVVAVTQLPPGGPAHPGGPVHPGGVAAGMRTASGSTVRAKLLAAFSAASGEIMYTHNTAENAGGRSSGASWDFPWGAKPGQRALGRTLVLNANGTPSIDIESIYTASAPRDAPIGEIIEVQYGNRTWSDQKHTIIDSAGLWNPAVLRSSLASMHPTVTGPVELDGHRAIELTWGVSGPSGMQTVNHFWVDARTYLPLRTVSSTRDRNPMFRSYSRTDFELLPATPANLAKLRVIVPAGFRRTAKVVK